jgi:YD repeat-containing protein
LLLHGDFILQIGKKTYSYVNTGKQTFNFAYDAENRLVSVTGAATASFVYNADGQRVKATVNGVTAVYVGNHYIIPLRDEVKNSVVTKYYFAGATRLAVRTGGTLSFLLGDHLGSSSLTTDANGVQTALVKPKPPEASFLRRFSCIPKTSCSSR